MKILILDDYAQPRKDVKQALEDILSNVEVTEFSNPHEALESYRTEDYDLVISDILMPDMNGFEFAAAALKEKVRPIIMHTGSWSQDYITQFVLNGSSEHVPIKVVAKKYSHDSFEEYKAALKEGIDEAVKKSRRLNNKGFGGLFRKIARTFGYEVGLNLKGLDKINAKLSMKDDFLYDYITAVYSELIKSVNEAASRLGDEELKKNVLGTEWVNPKAKDTLGYMHHFRGYPLPGLKHILHFYNGNDKDSQAYSDIQNLLEKMQGVTDVIMKHREMAIALPPEKRAYRRKLASQERKPIPMADFPVKLLGRQRYFQFLWDEQWTQNLQIISPESKPEQHKDAIDNMLDIYGPLIFRSMFRGEDGKLPLAGFFDSVVVKSIDEYVTAIKKIRAMDSKYLEEFCLHRGLEQPDAKDMFIGVEVYHETKFLGAMIEHPQMDGVYLIEFGARALGLTNWVMSNFILYNSKTKKIRHSLEGSELSLASHMEAFAGHIVSNCVRYLDLVEADRSIAQQIEFGLDIVNNAAIRTIALNEGVDQNLVDQMHDNYHVCPYQSRDFKSKSVKKDFKVENPDKASLMMGTTEIDGINCVVVDTVDPAEYAVIAEKIRAQGYGIAYVSRPREVDSDGKPVKYQDISVASFVEDVDVLITGKGLKVMSHTYFNAMVNAKNVVLLEPGQLDKLGHEQGDVVNFKSNGIRHRFSRIDSSEKVKYDITTVLNS